MGLQQQLQQPVYLLLLYQFHIFLNKMTGKSHVATSAMLSWLMIGDPVVTIAAIVAAKLPDQLERFIPGVKHRGLTHIAIFWILATATLFFIYHAGQTAQVKLTREQFITTSVFLGIALGGLLHIAMDFMSISGVPLFHSNKMYALKIYRTGGMSEYLVLCVIFVLAAWRIQTSYF